MIDHLSMGRAAKINWLVQNFARIHYLIDRSGGEESHFGKFLAVYSEEFRAILIHSEDEEIDALFVWAYQSYVYEVQTIEAEIDSLGFYISPDTFADIGYWARMETWNEEEATALSLNRDPRAVSSGRLEDAGATQTLFGKEYFARRHLISRSVAAHRLKERESPLTLIRWFEAKRLNAPPALIDLVTSIHNEPMSWRDVYLQELQIRQSVEAALQQLQDRYLEHEHLLRGRILELQQEALDMRALCDGLAQELEELRSKGADGEIVVRGVDVRRYKNALRILLAIAKAKYGLGSEGPRGLAAVGNIARTVEDDFSKPGEKTVRNILKEAQKLVGSEGTKFEGSEGQ